LWKGLCGKEGKCRPDHTCLMMPTGYSTCVWEGFHTRENCFLPGQEEAKKYDGYITCPPKGKFTMCVPEMPLEEEKAKCVSYYEWNWWHPWQSGRDPQHGLKLNFGEQMRNFGAAAWDGFKHFWFDDYHNSQFEESMIDEEDLHPWWTEDEEFEKRSLKAPL